MAHKKGVGSSRNGRDFRIQVPRRQAVWGRVVTAGASSSSSAARSSIRAKNVRRASNDSLFSVVDGHVKFEHKDKKRQQISVYPVAVKAAKN